jgi:hypothetical protein
MYLLLHVIEEEGGGGREEAHTISAGCHASKNRRELVRSTARVMEEGGQDRQV